MDIINWSRLFNELLEFLQSYAPAILIGMVAFWLIGRIVIVVTRRYLTSEETKHTIRKWTHYIVIVVGLLWVLMLYYSSTRRDSPFFLFLIGLFLAGVAFSMRDVFSNFVGWLVIVSDKGFRQGDRIAINGMTGDVIDIGIFRTILAEIGGWVSADQSTGRLVSIPNSLILSHPAYNYTAGYDFIWNEISLLVTFESNWEKAEEIVNQVALQDFESKQTQIQERLKKVRRKFLLRYNFISPKVYVSIADSGVCLTLRHMVRARARRTREDMLAREILRRFAAHEDIEFAYPTIRMYRAGEPVRNFAPGQSVPASSRDHP